MFAPKLLLCRQILRSGKHLNLRNFTAIASTRVDFINPQQNVVRFKYSVGNKGVKGGGKRKIPNIEPKHWEEFEEEDESDAGEKKESIFDDKWVDLCLSKANKLIIIFKFQRLRPNRQPINARSLQKHFRQKVCARYSALHKVGTQKISNKTRTSAAGS